MTAGDAVHSTADLLHQDTSISKTSFLKSNYTYRALLIAVPLLLIAVSLLLIAVLLLLIAVPIPNGH
jgi:hypothetical protein